ncbi:MAG: PTS mannose transporter subunit IID [Chloroflexales bacterium]|nr:PTS mannose transporter subunit IID [Chloroflexales bacterium]
MVSLLLVSHSELLAAGARELAAEMGHGKVAIAAVGGTSEGKLGTSVERIGAALLALAPDDGVLVLVDLGSAVFSAELALEQSGVRYRISNASLVEGAVFAAAAAAAGATLDQVAAAAEKSRTLVKVHDA